MTSTNQELFDKIRALHPHIPMREDYPQYDPDHPGVCGVCWDRGGRSGFQLWPCATIAAIDAMEG